MISIRTNIALVAFDDKDDGPDPLIELSKIHREETADTIRLDSVLLAMMADKMKSLHPS